MSAHLFSIMAQTDTGSEWNWLLIFIIAVIVLAIALVAQARFSAQEADEIAQEIHHDEAAHHEDMAHSEDEFHLEDGEVELIPGATQEVEPELELQVEPEPKEPASPDDLKKIEGIGPKVAALLAEQGISTFAQLAEASVENLAEILETAKLQMMDPASWPQQAGLANAGEWEALEKLQDELKGGR